MLKLKKKAKVKSGKDWYSNSSFWLNQDKWEYETRDENRGNSKDLVMLAGYQRAISNFVNIVTGKNIPVKFHTKDASFTDGSFITISSKLTDSKFDTTVGLALHEASHCILTDFDYVKRMDTECFVATFGSVGFDVLDPWIESYLRRYDTPLAKESFKRFMHGRMHELMNIIEDRRIDKFIYSNAPGYRGYYQAMYDEYFNSAAVTKALKSKQYRDSSNLDHWSFRLINMTNAKRDLNALRGFDVVFNTIDLANIDRLKSTSDVFDLAFKVFWQIIGFSGYVHEVPGEEPQQPLASEAMNDFFDSLDNDNLPNFGGASMSYEEIETSEGDYELSPMDQSRADRAFSKQREFLNHDVPKGVMSRKDADTVNRIADEPVEIKNAEVGLQNWNGETMNQSVKIPVTLIRECTENIMSLSEFEGTIFQSENRAGRDRTNAILEGARLGQILGRKLKIRNEERETKYNRLDTGKIDKRAIAGLGYGIESVFFRKDVSRYKPMHFHLSIDASGSMNGHAIDKCIMLSIAIATAAKMAGNINVTIDARSTYYTGNANRPVVAIFYDSRKHSLNRLHRIATRIYAGGMTPEGLCFDAIKEEVIRNAAGTDAIFMNFSDGAPSMTVSTNGGGCYQYNGKAAYDHTAKQMHAFRNAGIQIISYFIADGRYGLEAFKQMYGVDAEFISPSNIIEVSRSLNKRFLANIG